ncbi:MAG: hypothetical protein WAV00_06985 [Nocardioides sp.]
MINTRKLRPSHRPAGLALALTLGIAPYAVAQTDLHNDPAHDVRYAAPGDVLGPHLADPGQRNGDLRFVVTRHTPLHVSVMTKFRDLRRVGHVKHWYVVRGLSRTDRVVLSATPGHRSGQLTVRRYRSGRLVPCPGAIWRIDYRENRTA